MYERTSAEAFKAAAAGKAKESDASNRENSSGPNISFSQPFSFKYVGCDSPKNNGKNSRVVRFVGSPVKEDAASYKTQLGTDAHFVYSEKIIDQNKKQFLLTLPDPYTREGENNIIWKIFNYVNKKSWDPVTRVARKDILEDYPEVENIVNHCAIATSEKRYMYAPSWFPKQKLFINCIDRGDDWCKENKHTKVFCKSVNLSIDNEGVVTEWSEPGVKTNGFYDKLLTISAAFNGWESFDALISRTGSKTEPWRIKNASRLVSKELEEDYPSCMTKEEFIKQVSLSDITDEELSYERYDFDKEITYTSPRKIKYRLGNLIKRIDEILGTSFYDELCEQCGEDSTSEQDIGIQVSPDPVPVTESTTEVPVRPTAEVPVRPSASVANADLSSVVPNWNDLTKEEQDGIESASMEGSTLSITYKDKTAVIFACEKCGVPSPHTFTHCPGCGRAFN